jgi:prophage antirepressor-like protein
MIMGIEMQIQSFNDAKIRMVWDNEKKQYFFSIVDIIQVLTYSPTPRRYWSDLKRKLQVEGSEVYENIV